MIDSAISLLARVNHLEQSSPYGYTPGKAPGYAYVVVFGVGLLLHIGLAVRYKYWIAMVTLIPGGLCEWSVVSLARRGGWDESHASAGWEVVWAGGGMGKTGRTV